MGAAPICINDQAGCSVPSLANLFDRVIQHSARMHSITNDLHSVFVSMYVQYMFMYWCIVILFVLYIVLFVLFVSFTFKISVKMVQNAQRVPFTYSTTTVTHISNPLKISAQHFKYA